jgi:hypothetical protein
MRSPIIAIVYELYAVHMKVSIWIILNYLNEIYNNYTVYDNYLWYMS